MSTFASNRSKTPSSSQYLRHTKMPVLMFLTAGDLARYVADVVAKLIRENNAAGVPTVLGLPTGSTPVGVYRELIRLHQDDGLDFSRVVTFNLDEYYPISPDAIQSYNRWMREVFFNHVNVPAKNIHIPKGDIPRDEVDAFCEQYEREIERFGGIQLQLLGIGRTGHIGFNEPGSSRNSVTRLVTLDPTTRTDAASDFFGEENVPPQAITMGVDSILQAKKVVIMALGEHKAPIVRRAVEEEVTDDVTASFLQKHPYAVFALDAASASELTAIKFPWQVGRVAWTPQMEKRAVFWLCEELNKPIPILSHADFLENHLADLLRERGPVEKIRQRLFDDLMGTICTKPAGDGCKTVVVFSPHPDDDVISMGGTLITLAEQGHNVHVAYQTSGNVAVFDHDALRHIDFVSECLSIFNLQTNTSQDLFQRMRQDMTGKKPGQPDSVEVLHVKALIRKTEATHAAATAGVLADKLHFLDLPFYHTGTVKKLPIGDADVQIIARLLRELKPDQVYLAGDLSDPHGTHRMCAQAILKALQMVEPEGLRPETWLYRGAWQEYEPHEIERAVPLSPELVERKKQAIFRHESQKDSALFPGADKREFWVRAEDRTKHTAALFNRLGLPEFYALEGFVHYRGQL